MNAESDAAKPYFMPYMSQGMGLSVGFGGAKMSDTENEVTFDMVRPYCPSFKGDTQILRGDARRLSAVCDNAFTWLGSSHLVEDFEFPELVDIVKDWARVIKPGGYLLTCAPWQQKYLAYNEKQGTSHLVNLAHKESTFGLDTWNMEVLQKTGLAYDVLLEQDLPPYSWCQAIRIIK